MLAAIAWGALRMPAAPRRPARRSVGQRGGGRGGRRGRRRWSPPSNIVPGLLLAFPLATAGILALRRATCSRTAATVVPGVTAALFALARHRHPVRPGRHRGVGRAVLRPRHPVAVPVLLAALRLEGRRLAAAGAAVRRRRPGGLLGRPLRDGRRRSSGPTTATKVDLVARIEDAGRATGERPAGRGHHLDRCAPAGLADLRRPPLAVRAGGGRGHRHPSPGRGRDRPVRLRHDRPGRRAGAAGRPHRGRLRRGGGRSAVARSSSSRADRGEVDAPPAIP